MQKIFEAFIRDEILSVLVIFIVSFTASLLAMKISVYKMKKKYRSESKRRVFLDEQILITEMRKAKSS